LLFSLRRIFSKGGEKSKEKQRASVFAELRRDKESRKHPSSQSYAGTRKAERKKARKKVCMH
jgi:hypothetical protein